MYFITVYITFIYHDTTAPVGQDLLIVEDS